MKRILSTALLLAGLNGCWTSMALAQQAKSFDLSASRQPSNGETIELQIVTGPLPPGAKVVAHLGHVVPQAPEAAPTVNLPASAEATLAR